MRCGSKLGACTIAFTLVFAISSGTAQAKNDGIETAGDVIKLALPAAGAVLNLVHQDADGALQLGVSVVGSYGTSFLLQQIIKERRPDHSGKDSFPSDSTAVAFAAASSMQVRYGWDYGLPAYALAAFVGYSRVAAEKHHWYDVAAGAAIGLGIGQLVTSRYQRSLDIQAFADTRSAGIEASWHW